LEPSYLQALDQVDARKHWRVLAEGRDNEMMLLWFKIVLLLWLINFAPPFLAYVLEEKWNSPLDQGWIFFDGKPFLGDHKTVRGVLAAVLMGMGAGMVLDFRWWEGLSVAALSVLGDLLSSFIKRRAGWASGNVTPGLDQGFEGLLPLLFLSARYSLRWETVFFLLFLFSFPAFLGSWFFKKILSQQPYERYPRRLSPRVRLRELRACHIASDPLYRLLNFENALYYHVFMKTVFRITGVYQKGVRNALQIRLQRFTLPFPDLPTEFENYTILFLSDLHLDGIEGLTEALQALVGTVSVDLCILGGDFRMEMYGSSRETLLRMEKLVKSIHCKDGIYAILGNHDCVEMVRPLENEGIQFLINESAGIERGCSRIWLVGLDDPHYYRCHDLRQAFSEVPKGEFSVCAVHSPEIYREAATFGARLYLCGHTHGGQIQIPHVGPLFTHSRAPRRLSYGLWTHRGMVGLTSSGAGASGVPVRFFTRGEVVHITLKRGGLRKASPSQHGQGQIRP
jgi:predicted MPP superfamily phosphohydrolase